MTNILCDDIIFDAQTSNRTVLENGTLLIKNCILTKSEVSKYLGREIGKEYKNLFDLNDTTVYNVYRDSNAIKNAKDKFANLPVLNEHTILSADNPPPNFGIGEAVGVTGQDVIYKDNAIFDSILIISKIGRELIEDGKVGLSAGYRYKLVKQKGNFDGVDYDFVMTDIMPDHVALVDKARVKEARIADADFKKIVSNSADNIVSNKVFDNKTMENNIEALKSVDDVVDFLMKKMGIPDDDENNMTDGKARDNKSFLKDTLEQFMNKKDDDDTVEAKATDNAINSNTIAKNTIAFDADMIDQLVDAKLNSKIEKIREGFKNDSIAFDSACNLAQKHLGKINRSSYAMDTKSVYVDILKAKAKSLDTTNLTLNELKSACIALDSALQNNNYFTTHRYFNDQNNAINNNINNGTDLVAENIKKLMGL